MPRKKSTRSDAESGERSGRTRPFWSGTITFGLVTIPVELYSATHDSRRSLRLIAPSGHPVSRRYFTEDGKPLQGEQIARGYEVDDEYIVVTDEELEALAPEQSRDIELSRFVDQGAVSPLFFEHAYVLAPAGNSNAAYRLLASTLEKTGKAGIARFVMRGKQYPVAIFGRAGLLRAHTMRFAEELRTPKSVGLPKVEEPDGRKLRSLRTLIGKHKLRGGPQHVLTDRNEGYEKKLEALVRKKQKQGEDVVHVQEAAEVADNGQMAEVIDLVAILKKSLGQGGEGAANSNAKSEPAKATKKKPAKRASPKRATKRAAHGK